MIDRIHGPGHSRLFLIILAVTKNCAERISIALQDGHEHKAVIVGSDHRAWKPREWKRDVHGWRPFFLILLYSRAQANELCSGTVSRRAALPAHAQGLLSAFLGLYPLPFLFDGWFLIEPTILQFPEYPVTLDLPFQDTDGFFDILSVNLYLQLLFFLPPPKPPPPPPPDLPRPPPPPKPDLLRSF